MAYQSLPWQDGDSESFKKLLCLTLPPLTGKRVLDVGCNTGFFCGWAAYQGAALARGIDTRADAVAQAREWFPYCDFQCMGWDDLDDEKYDVILLLSAIHYAEDQESLIHHLMRRVTDSGLLVLELGVIESQDDAFRTIQRSIDVRQFPTKKKMTTMLAPYAAKLRGPSVAQKGDPIPRWVYHVHHPRPVATLLLDNSSSGKSTYAGKYLRADVPFISVDVLYADIIQGNRPAPERLVSYFSPDLRNANYGVLTESICSGGHLDILLDFIEGEAGGRSFSLDWYVPHPFREEVETYFRTKGYFVARVNLAYAFEDQWRRQFNPLDQYFDFIRQLEVGGLVNSEEYLAANPDVAKAVQDGRIPNAQYHYHHFGRREGRKVRP